VCVSRTNKISRTENRTNKTRMSLNLVQRELSLELTYISSIAVWRL
jgi:hypothetical protein